ncbi:hypothetical protein A3860_04995 [Niastella vici]|uniref:Methyltransferase domain-containing protein n=1 Tax=Niastella vici TaxID=1703345 RepID=A0A1V9FS11_9BACT|nr:class I SAM-dependent methyltransferase [Niastella vici]OQP61077.1 hypothetical protein A3860_04995 [Niastella vici]
MSNTDVFNLTLIDSNEEIDQINKKFYGRFNYPWPPSVIHSYPADVTTLFLNQDIGNWEHQRIPTDLKIWVAGCGTNQALLTALKFPQAQVYGTDLSTQSINTCRKNADQIGVKNLVLEEKSLNQVDYEEEFDYIICTGVVHHNANPEITLNRISRALKKNGIMEFMVYNFYHRIASVACQKAIRNFYDTSSTIDLDLELTLIKKLLADFQYDGLMKSYLSAHVNMPEAQMVDQLIQPNEYSYTVESLGELLENCNLQYLQPCQNQFDIDAGRVTWNMKFTDEYLKAQYNALPDVKRWQISNLLMMNNSPMLWFYLQRKDATIKRSSEESICSEFLETSFSKSSMLLNTYYLDNNKGYLLNEKPLKFPIPATITDNLIRRIYQAAHPGIKMKDILHQLKVRDDFYEVNEIRIKLTTSGYPFLLAAV